MGSVYEHGLPDQPRAWSLEGRPIRLTEREEVLRQCPECQMIALAAEYRDSTCPFCGALIPGKADPRVERARMAAIRETHTAGKRREAYRALAATAREKGHKPGWAAMRFRSRYGRFPTEDERA